MYRDQKSIEILYVGQGASPACFDAFRLFYLAELGMGPLSQSTIAPPASKAAAPAITAPVHDLVESAAPVTIGGEEPVGVIAVAENVPFLDVTVGPPGEVPVPPPIPVALVVGPLAEQEALDGAYEIHSAPRGGSPRLSSQLPGRIVPLLQRRMIGEVSAAQKAVFPVQD